MSMWKQWDIRMTVGAFIPSDDSCNIATPLQGIHIYHPSKQHASSNSNTIIIKAKDPSVVRSDAHSLTYRIYVFSFHF